jgi:2-polyprenyl-6-hydroxyphenyl methylase/3-demethylubiquinone-9 3-methyltransferase
VGDFERFANTWFDQNGEMGLLHAMNKIRIPFVLNSINCDDHGLDVGTGGGLVPLTLAAQKINIEGLDSEQALIDIARKEAIDRNLSILYHCHPVETFTPIAQYDFITCFEMLEHVDNPKLVCERLVSWLKPGGWLFISTINRSLAAYISAIVLAEYIFKWLPYKTHSFEKFITPEELIQYLEPCVCKDIRGMIFNPLESSKFFLGESLSINYIGAWQKPKSTID